MNEAQKKEEIKGIVDYIDKFFKEKEQSNYYEKLIPTNEELKAKEQMIEDLRTPLSFFIIYKNKALLRKKDSNFFEQNSNYKKSEKFHEKVDFAKDLINSNEKQYLQLIIKLIYY